jgi:hypothetical protein
VAYGANGKFNFLNSTGGTPCTNALFGDPLYGTFKACYIKDIPVATSSPTPAPSPPAPAVNINGSSVPTVVAHSAVVQLGIQNGPGNATDWLGLYLPGAPNSAYLGYAYVPSGATSATVPFTMPSTTGTYEFRFFANNEWTLLATSPTVTVGVSTAPPSLPPSPPPVSAPPPVSGLCTANCFYVATTGSDSNPGTQAAPWRTLRKAASTLTAGQTAIVLDGTYEEGEVAFMRSGTATAPITIKAQNKWKAILSTVAGCNPAISSSGSYSTVEDLRISVSPNNVMCTIYNGHAVAIHVWESNAPRPNNPSSGFVGFTARGLLMDYSPAAQMAIKTNQDFTVIENNIVHHQLEPFNTNGTIVRNNVLYGGGIIVKGGSRNTQVYNNIVHFLDNSRDYGVLLGGLTGLQWMFDGPTGWEAYNAVAYNNIVLNESGSTSVGLYGLRGCQNCTIVNNVGIGGHVYMQYGGMSGLKNQNPTFHNNIITCNGSNALGSWDTYWSGTITIDYNNFFNCSGAPGQGHAVVGDPKFVDPTSDWHLQSGSIAIGAGVKVNVVGFNAETIDISTDKDGNIRIVPWNLGIY